MIAAVHDYTTGDKLGNVEIDAWHAAQYAEGVHDGYQWPQGITEAGWLLDADALTALGVPHGRTVYLEV